MSVYACSLCTVEVSAGRKETGRGYAASRSGPSRALPGGLPDLRRHVEVVVHGAAAELHLQHRRPLVVAHGGDGRRGDGEPAHGGSVLPGAANFPANGT